MNDLWSNVMIQYHKATKTPEGKKIIELQRKLEIANDYIAVLVKENHAHRKLLEALDETKAKWGFKRYLRNYLPKEVYF